MSAGNKREFIDHLQAKEVIMITEKELKEAIEKIVTQGLRDYYDGSRIITPTIGYLYYAGVDIRHQIMSLIKSACDLKAEKEWD